MRRAFLGLCLLLTAIPAAAQILEPGGRLFRLDPPVEREPLAPPPGYDAPYDDPFAAEDPPPSIDEELYGGPSDLYGPYPEGPPDYPDTGISPNEGYGAPPPGFETTPPLDGGPVGPTPGAPAETPIPNVPDPVAPAQVAPPTLSPEELIEAVDAAEFMPATDLGARTGGKLGQSPLVVKLQILLDRAGVSPGVIDGYYGFNVQKAVAAFEAMSDLSVDGVVDAEVWARLRAISAAPVLTAYEITAEDVAGPFVQNLPTDYAELAKLDRLAFRNPAELLAERFHMDLDFLRQINPTADFAAAGGRIIVADPGPPVRERVVHLAADKRTKQLIGYSAAGRIVVAYPATIGSSSLPSPAGRHVVEAVAMNPEYWYRPDVNFKQGNNTKPLRLPPGPNGPVGAVWIDLSEPTYGIHGTPDPDRIDKGFSHGCVRLTNWDAAELAHLVTKGVPVDFVE